MLFYHTSRPYLTRGRPNLVICLLTKPVPMLKFSSVIDITAGFVVFFPFKPSAFLTIYRREETPVYP